MLTIDAARQRVAGAPVSYQTSGWQLLRSEAAGAAVAAVVVGGALWLSGVTEPLFVVGVPLAYAVAHLAWVVGRFRLLGVAEVRIEPEALTVRTHGGEERRIARADLVHARRISLWSIRGRDETVRIRETGFTSDDWAALSIAIRHWATPGPEAALARVTVAESGPERGAVVFDAHRPVPATLTVAGIAGLCSLPFLLRLPAYADGSWAETTFFSVVLPVLGLASAAVLVVYALRQVRRVTFGADAMRIERVVGPARSVPYADVLDVMPPHVDTRRGSFVIDVEHDSAFFDLLADRVDRSTLTGFRWLRRAFWSRRRNWLRVGLGGAALGAGAWWLAGAVGLDRPWADVVAVAVVVAYGAIFWYGVRLWARLATRHGID